MFFNLDWSQRHIQFCYNNWFVNHWYIALIWYIIQQKLHWKIGNTLTHIIYRIPKGIFRFFTSILKQSILSNLVILVFKIFLKDLLSDFETIFEDINWPRVKSSFLNIHDHYLYLNILSWTTLVDGIILEYLYHLVMTKISILYADFSLYHSFHLSSY